MTQCIELQQWPYNVYIGGRFLASSTFFRFPFNPPTMFRRGFKMPVVRNYLTFVALTGDPYLSIPCHHPHLPPLIHHSAPYIFPPHPLDSSRGKGSLPSKLGMNKEQLAHRWTTLFYRDVGKYECTLSPVSCSFLRLLP